MPSDSAKAAPPRVAVDGFLNIDKPADITTMDVVRRIKRASRQRRVGHGGTLDPIATGVVPICIGQATRTMQYLIEGTRVYRAEIELGISTDTYDAHGKVTATGDPSSVALSDLERALQSFNGTIDQVPPMYSALKIEGKRLYDLARAGIEVERKARRIETVRVDLRHWSPPVLTLEVKCSRGFYMRSLAHDLGQALGCGGHMKGLARLRSGPFKLTEAISLGDAEQRIADGSWLDDLHHPDSVVRHMRAVIVGDRTEQMLRQGRPIPPGQRIPFSKPNEHCRAYGADGSFVAIISFDAARAQWKPERVFSLRRSEGRARV